MPDVPEDDGKRPEPESLADVLASIRTLVSAEAEARASGGAETVLMLTEEMRLDAPSGLSAGQVLASDLGEGDLPRGTGTAPILDEESLRRLINAIVREELQGELGDRIGRNLRKLIRREVAQVLAERDEDPTLDD